MRIFFDVDGVLIDGWHANGALRKSWDATIKTDLGVDRQAFQSLLFGTAGGRSTSLMLACVTGHCDLKDALADVLPQVGFKGSVDDFMRYWFEKDSNINTGVFELVADIRMSSKVQMYVASNQEHHRARYLWDELGFSRHFDGMLYSAAIGYPKKDVRFFEAINRLLGVGPRERPLFFDDQPEIVALAGSIGWDGTAFMSARDIREHPRLRHIWP